MMGDFTFPNFKWYYKVIIKLKQLDPGIKADNTEISGINLNILKLTLRYMSN